MKKVSYLFLFLVICSFSGATQSISFREQATLWNRLHLVKKARAGIHSFGLLVENRQYLDPWRGHMFLAELNYQRSVSQRSSLGGHFTYLIFTLPHEPSAESSWRKDEIRFHQSWKRTWLPPGNHRLVSRVMLEERFFKSYQKKEEVSGFEFGYLRLRTRLTYGFKLSDRLEWIISDEFMFQTPKDISIRFDQNRLDTFFRYGLTPNIALDLGYLNWYQETTAVTYLRHAIRTGIFIRI